MQPMEELKRLETRVRELESAELELLERLALAAEYGDPEARPHIRQVGELAGRLARELGLDDAEAERIARAALLHDVGKIGQPQSVLSNPGRLSPAEVEEMRLHPTIGATILSGSAFALLRLAEDIARTHHERWDGEGYPFGLAGERIPLAGRIVALADAFDALQRERGYKPAWPLEKVLGEIEAQSGRQFDPQIVAALMRLVRRRAEAVGDAAPAAYPERAACAAASA